MISVLCANTITHFGILVSKPTKISHNSPDADAVAVNPVVDGPNELSPGKAPTPLAHHNPNIGACCVPLS